MDLFLQVMGIFPRVRVVALVGIGIWLRSVYHVGTVRSIRLDSSDSLQRALYRVASFESRSERDTSLINESFIVALINVADSDTD